MHVKLGPYHVRDVKFVAAFDVDAKKVGFDLSEAIFASENNTIKIADVPPTDIVVQRPTLDGIGKYYADTIEISDDEPVDVVKVLKGRKGRCAGVLPAGGVRSRPTSSTRSAPSMPVAFVNALPVFIASDPVWAKKFEDAGVPDRRRRHQKSQVGATITHRVMAKLFEDRGVTLDRTYQLNVGGNMDFKNMLERERLESKKVSKTQPSPPT